MKNQKETKQQYKWLKYTGLGFQMVAVIGIGALIGHYLDAHFNMEQPLFTAGFSLVFVIAAIYIAVKDLL